MENLDLIVKETIVYKHNRLRCLDLSYNYIFAENYKEKYGEHFRQLECNYSEFLELKYLEAGWDDSLFNMICRDKFETTLFYKQINPQNIEEMPFR